MMRWFIADLHLGDPWTSKMRYCGSDTDKQDETLARSWDRHIDADDEVFVLGDLALESFGQDRLVEWMDARPGSKRFVRGNWDSWIDFAPLGGAEDSLTIALGGSEVTLCHYPYSDPSAPEAHMPLIHGHTHQRQRLTHHQGYAQVHVGWEAWRMPVSEARVLETMEVL